MADEPVNNGPDASVAAPENSELADLQRERDDFKDRWLRKGAEFDNYRKRIERERREQGDQAVVEILQELLLVVDDFDRALTVGGDEGGAYRKGVEPIHGKPHELLRKQGSRRRARRGFRSERPHGRDVRGEPDHREGEVIGDCRRLHAARPSAAARDGEGGQGVSKRDYY
jgi:molecular chaperone GrpE